MHAGRVSPSPATASEIHPQLIVFCGRSQALPLGLVEALITVAVAGHWANDGHTWLRPRDDGQVAARD